MALISSNLEGLRFAVRDQSYVGAARRALKQFAEGMGLCGEPLDKLNLLVSELATNLAKHAANGGEILAFCADNYSSSSSCTNSSSCSSWPSSSSKGMRIVAIDRGPGICDIDAVMTDGVSGTNTLGCGLGSLKRLSDKFEIVSEPGLGTVVLCTITEKEHSPLRPHSKKNWLDIGYVSAPHPCETSHNGDTVSVAYSDEIASILVVDGLGHGPDAAAVAEFASRSFQKSPFADAQSIVSRIHQDIQGTRGAALALVQLHRCTDKISFVGVGNISCRVFMKYANRGCPSIQGIVGSQMGNLKEYTYDWGPKADLLIFTDGIKSCASLEGALPKSADMLAAQIYRDNSRQNDDATVVVVRDNRS